MGGKVAVLPMTPALAALQREIHQRTLNYRAVDRIVHSVEFSEALKLDPENNHMRLALLMGNVSALNEWIETTLEKQVGDLSVKDLRKLAGELGIRNYVSFSKDALLLRVLEVQHARRTEKVSSGMPPNG